MFQVFSREPSERGEGGNFEVVVRIPRADALGRPLKKEQPYIVAHPRFTAQAKAEDPPDAIELEEQEQEKQQKPCAPDASGAAAQVYVSFDPNDEDSTQLAQIVTDTVLDPYDIRYRCFGPTEGVFLHQDFQKHVQESDFFLVIMSAGYFESLESRQGRPYKEALAAMQKLPAENVVVVQRAELPSPWAAASGSLSPPQLRQLFVVKPLKFHDNLGHLAAFEEHILTTLGVLPRAKAVQTPLAASLQSWGLGHHSYALAAHAGLNFPEDLAALSESELLRLGVLAPCQAQIRNQLQAMPPGAAAGGRPHIPESKRNAKALVDLMWGAARRNPQLRDAVAEELRRISSTQDGLDDIRTFAGLETLVKLVAEGSINEKIAAVWALRNYAVVDLYRSKIVASGVLPTLVTLLSAQEVECLHATADLLHLLSTDHPKNVVRIGQAGAVKRLVALLNVSHLPLKRATLGALANLSAAEASRVRIGKYGGVHRIVAALRNEGATDARCRDLALSALSQLVQVDANRLKTWRCGGVDVLRAIAEGGPMLPRMIAVNTLKALMAGPMIQPGEEFRTKNGRTLSAGEMRSAIRRLSQIPGLQRGSASGAEKGAPRPRPALVHSAAANRRELESRMSRPRQSTQLSRHDFDDGLRARTTPEALQPRTASGASSSWGGLEHSYSGLMINEAWTDLKDREPALRPWESTMLRSYPAEDVKSEIAGAYRPYTMKQHIPVTTRMYVLDGPVMSTHLRAFRNDPEFETFVRWKQLPLPDYHPGMFGGSSATGGAANKQKPKRPATAGPSYYRGDPKRNGPRPASQGSYTPRSMPEPGSPPPLMTHLSPAKSGILKTAQSPSSLPGRTKSIVFAEGTATQSDSEDSPPATARTAEETKEGQAALQAGLLGKLGPKSRWKVLTTVLQVAKPQKVYRSVLGRSMTHEDMHRSVERLSSRQPSIRQRAFPLEVPAC